MTADDTAPVPQDTDRLSEEEWRSVLAAVPLSVRPGPLRRAVERILADRLAAERERGRAELEQALAEQREGIAAGIEAEADAVPPGTPNGHLRMAAHIARAYRGGEGR